jgi:hypothetical protein
LVAKAVQFLNFGPQAAPIVQESASGAYDLTSGTEDPGLLDSSRVCDET